MVKVDIEKEKEVVENTIKEWYKAATEMNLESFMELASDGFVLLNPGRAAIKGKEEFKSFFYEYGERPHGPVTLGDSWIGVSETGNMAYQYGTHHHVIYEEEGSRISTWKQLIVLKKINNAWKLVAMSETSSRAPAITPKIATRSLTT